MITMDMNDNVEAVAEVEATIQECDLGWTQRNEDWNGGFTSTEDLIDNLVQDLRGHLETHLSIAGEDEDGYAQYQYSLKVSLVRLPTAKKVDPPGTAPNRVLSKDE